MRKLPRREMNKLTQGLREISGVETVVLYGSIARGDYGPNSDMDILVIVRDRKSARLVREALSEIDLSRPLQPTIRTAKQLEQTDFGLLRKIFQEGIVLLCNKPQDLPAAGLLQLKPHILFAFDLKGVPQKEKARLNRLLYHSKTGGHSGGLVGEANGRKLGRGCILVPKEAQKKIQSLFNRFKVRAESIDIWL